VSPARAVAGRVLTAVDDPTTGPPLFYAKLIPNRGAWLEFETSNKDVMSVKVDASAKLPVTTLLRASDTRRTRDQGRSSRRSTSIRSTSTSSRRWTATDHEHNEGSGEVL